MRDVQQIFLLFMYFHFYLCIFILNDRSNDKARHIDVALCIVVVYDATALYSPSLSTKNVGEINPPSKGSE